MVCFVVVVVVVSGRGSGSDETRFNNYFFLLQDQRGERKAADTIEIFQRVYMYYLIAVTKLDHHAPDVSQCFQTLTTVPFRLLQTFDSQ